MKRRVFFDLLLVVYLLILFRITVFRSGFCDHALFSGELNLVPFSDLALVIEEKPLSFLYLFFGNILWFVPFGYYLKREKRCRLFMTVFLGFCLSLGIEMMQYVFGTGISETDDLILNTAGAFLGALFGMIPMKQKKNRQPDKKKKHG